MDLPLAIFHMLSAIDGAKTASLPYGILVSRILLSDGVDVGPYDDVVRGKGKITYRTISLSASHIHSDDSDAENEAQRAAAEEADDLVTAQFEHQMPGYFQDFENRLYDQSTQIELLENKVDTQF